MTEPVLGVLALWGLFAGTHAALSSQRLRPRLVARFGEPAFLGSYSLVALASFVPLVWFYLSPFVVAAGVALAIALRLLHAPLFR